MARSGVAVGRRGSGSWGAAALSRAGRVWFRHPLLADLLLLAADAHRPATTVHAAYAAAIEDRIAGQGETPGLVAAAALHHHAAGAIDAAFQWAVRAAAEAERLSAWTIADDALERACALWPEVSAEVQAESPGLLALLRRAAGAARRAGALEPPPRLPGPRPACAWTNSPIRSSRARSSSTGPRRPGTPHPHGRQHILPEVFRAIALTDEAPDSPERAVALAELAIARVWNDIPEPADGEAAASGPGWAASRASLEVAGRSGAPAGTRSGSLCSGGRRVLRPGFGGPHSPHGRLCVRRRGRRRGEDGVRGASTGPTTCSTSPDWPTPSRCSGACRRRCSQRGTP